MAVVLLLHVQFTYGRQLKHHSHQTQNTSYLPNDHANGTSFTKGSETVTTSDEVAEGAQSPPSMPRRLDDYRPTAPGRSPGVGHSIQN
ncbi:hypothetical protein V2J09_021745 [Rumex salicifolius]